MIQRLLLLSVVFFWLSSSSSSQEYTYDGQLTQDDIDQSILYGSPGDINQMDEDKTYMDQIIVPNDYQATTGCLLVQERTWNGTIGGQCANGNNGTYTFGYGQTVIAQTQDAVAEALKVAGITVVGYLWQWRIKNADTNYFNEQSTAQGGTADPLIITVTVKDKQGNVLDEREWDYSYYIYNWQTKYGMHWYDPFISGDKIDTITLEVEAYDKGFWAGYYGPEFGSAGIYSILVVEPPDPCKQIPIVDPTCEGFIGEAPKEDPAVKELVIIESTGSIPLSEDELTVLASLEEEEETYEEQIEEKEEQNNVDALAVARNAEANALADAASIIDNTLSATATSLEQDITQSNQINQQSQEQAELSLTEAESIQQSSIELSTEMNNSMTQITLETTSQTQEQTSQTSANIQTADQNNGSVDATTFLSELNQSQQEPMIELEITVDAFEIAALDNAINDAVMNLIKMEQNIIREQGEE